MWDTLTLLPKEVIPKPYQDRIQKTPQCESFMHLHLGFDAQVSFLGVENVAPLFIIEMGKGLDLPRTICYLPLLAISCLSSYLSKCCHY